jgi:5'-nucleotidase
MPKIEDIALFDMDGTLCDFPTALAKSLEELRSPGEPIWVGHTDNAPDYIKKRADIICRSEEWWANLPKFQLGWDVLGIAKELDYNIMVLTQGPRRNPAAWSGKKRWLDKYLGTDIDVTMTRDKGLVYGRVFVDDWPKYIQKWLTWRKNGVVIMPASEDNKNFAHVQVTRYDGSNLDIVKRKLIEAKRT